MKYISAFLSASFVTALPFVALAQEGDKDTVQGYLILITSFVGSTIIPFLFALALLFFLVNVARYFIAGGNDAESQETAKQLALYGIGAFVFLISIWGIVNMFVESIEIDDAAARCPDYLGRWCTSRDAYGIQFNDYQFNNDNDESYFGDLAPGDARTETFSTFDEDGNLTSETDISVTSYDEDGNIINPEPNVIMIPDGGGVPEEPDEEIEVHEEPQVIQPSTGGSGTGGNCIEINGSLRCESDESPAVNIGEIIGS